MRAAHWLYNASTQRFASRFLFTCASLFSAMTHPRTPSGPEAAVHTKKIWFLRVFMENGGFMERAIKECHTSRRFINEQLDTDEDFAATVQAIKDQNNEKIEEEIYRRAVTGNEKPLVHQGQLTGQFVKEYSDNLLMFYAKANMPGKYRDLPQGKGSDISDEELNNRITTLMKKRGKDDAPEPAELIN